MVDANIFTPEAPMPWPVDALIGAGLGQIAARFISDTSLTTTNHFAGEKPGGSQMDGSPFTYEPQRHNIDG